MRLSEDVIRYLTVKQDGPLPTPKSTTKDDEPEKSETEKEIKPTEDKNESPEKDEKKEDTKE